MSPLAVLTAIVLGSAVAIAFGLSAVLVIFWIIRDESAQVGVEIGRLPAYCLLFLTLSALAGGALYSLAKGLSWRWRAQAGMWAGVVGVGMAIWMSRS